MLTTAAQPDGLIHIHHHSDSKAGKKEKKRKKRAPKFDDDFCNLPEHDDMVCSVQCRLHFAYSTIVMFSSEIHNGSVIKL